MRSASFKSNNTVEVFLQSDQNAQWIIYGKSNNSAEVSLNLTRMRRAASTSNTAAPISLQSDQNAQCII